MAFLPASRLADEAWHQHQQVGPLSYKLIAIFYFTSESVQQQMCELQCNICSKIVAHAAEITASFHCLAKENCTIHQKYKTNLNLRFNYTADIQKYELLFVYLIIRIPLWTSLLLTLGTTVSDANH